MTILLHGENNLASRNRLRQLNGVEIVAGQPLPQENSLFSQNTIFIIWQDKKLSATKIKELEKLYPGLIAEEFKVNPVVFRFLDALKPGNQVAFLPLWREYLKNDPPEVAFVMIIRQFRLMLNPADLAPWQAAKIRTQARNFPEISKIYKQLLEIDYRGKTSQMDLQTSLELFMLGL